MPNVGQPYDPTLSVSKQEGTSAAPQRSCAAQAESDFDVRMRLDLLEDRVEELRELLLEAQDGLVQRDQQIVILQNQINFMASTRAWRVGAWYVHRRNRLLGTAKEATETGLDLVIVTALLAPVVVLGKILYQLRRKRSTAAG